MDFSLWENGLCFCLKLGLALPYAQQVSGSCLANMHPHIPIHDIDYSEAENEKIQKSCGVGVLIA